MLLQVAAVPAPQPELICRRVEVTGSIARKERVCRTKAEWRDADEWGNRRARAIVDESRGRMSDGL
ncbi:hypothetical protein [Sphingomonas dokdonensis]|nr:hypothetical protein [Sphingomonas dokdonensis]